MCVCVCVCVCVRVWVGGWVGGWANQLAPTHTEICSRGIETLGREVKLTPNANSPLPMERGKFFLGIDLSVTQWVGGGTASA